MFKTVAGQDQNRAIFGKVLPDKVLRKVANLVAGFKVASFLPAARFVAIGQKHAIRRFFRPFIKLVCNGTWIVIRRFR